MDAATKERMRVMQENLHEKRINKLEAEIIVLKNRVRQIREALEIARITIGNVLEGKQAGKGAMETIRRALKEG